MRRRRIRRKVGLTPAQQRAVLRRLERPDIEGLVPFVAADLKRRESQGFGEFPIHKALLPEQLDALAVQVPSLFENRAFVHTRLSKMRPGADVDLLEDIQEQQAWLDRI